MRKTYQLITLALMAAFVLHDRAAAQVAGASITTDVSVVASAQVALGWSVRKNLLGKTIYNEAGKKVGKVQDIIIAPDSSVSYIIVQAGGLIDMGRHDVAVPVSQIKAQGGKLVMPGATVASIKALPEFEYVDDSARRDKFVASAEKDITRGNAKLAELERKTDASSAESKANIDQDIATLRVDVKSAQAKLSELNHVAAKRWREFEASVSAATTRLRASIDKTRA
jgi:sporulation protein YlmC with PRC-barrel domain